MAKEHLQQYSYNAIMLKHKNLAAAVELNLKNLAPLLQCTSINRCALFITSKKKYYFIKFLSPLLLKKYFFPFSFSLSLRLLFFLPLPVLHFNQTGLSTQSIAPKLNTDHSSLPSADRSPAQHQPKSSPAPTTLCILHLKGRTSKLHPLSATSFPAPMWVCVCVFQSVVGKWACVCVCGSGLVLVVGFFFFLLWTVGSGGGGGGGGSGGCACG